MSTRLNFTFSVCPRSDIVLLLDSTFSEYNDLKLEYSLKFAENLAKNFRIGLNKTRMAVVTFDDKPRLQWDLRDSLNNGETKNKIKEIEFSNGTEANIGK